MENKVGRNDPCPCGSGKKYKNCHYGQELKKTYTASGKRKFKATVLTSTDKSQSVFQGTPTAPKSPGEAPPIDLLKFRRSKVDYREGGRAPEVPFGLPEHERLIQPSTEEEKPGVLPEEFEVTERDYREKGEDKKD